MTKTHEIFFECTTTTATATATATTTTTTTTTTITTTNTTNNNNNTGIYKASFPKVTKRVEHNTVLIIKYIIQFYKIKICF